MPPIPQAPITKQDGNTGAVTPATTGILAIIAFSLAGVANVAQSYGRYTDIQQTNGLGPQVDFAAYFMNTAKKPVVVVTPTCTTAGVYGSITKTGTGTSTPTAGGTAPCDDFQVQVKFPAGGTIGVTGITYQYSLDGGNNWSGILALGTATTITLLAPPLPGLSTGVSFTLGAGTIVANDSFTCVTTRPQMQNSDLVTALEALRTTKLPWDNVLIDVDASSTMVATVDSWLSGLNALGVYKFAWMNTRKKNRPVPATETDATYQTAMSTLLATTSTINVDVGTDGGDLPSPVTGLVIPRPTSLAVATRKMQYGLGVDPAFVGNGPIPGFQIRDSSGNLKWHDEDPASGNPGLDAQRLSTLRSIPGKQGVYVTNAHILSASGSDYIWDQHAVCMNAACNLAYQLLTDILSKGVNKNPPDPTTNKIYILEADAKSIEDHINPQLQAALNKQVVAVQFNLSRTDDLSSNSSSSVTAELQIVALAYIKNVATTAKFVKSITVSTAGNG